MSNPYKKPFVNAKPDKNGKHYYHEHDVYDVLKAFGVTCQATGHAVKKLLCAGQRGAKSRRQDLEEAITAIRRAVEMAGEE